VSLLRRQQGGLREGAVGQGLRGGTDEGGTLLLRDQQPFWAVLSERLPEVERLNSAKSPPDVRRLFFWHLYDAVGAFPVDPRSGRCPDHFRSRGAGIAYVCTIASGCRIQPGGSKPEWRVDAADSSLYKISPSHWPDLDYFATMSPLLQNPLPIRNSRVSLTHSREPLFFLHRFVRVTTPIACPSFWTLPAAAWSCRLR